MIQSSDQSTGKGLFSINYDIVIDGAQNGKEILDVRRLNLTPLSKGGDAIQKVYPTLMGREIPFNE